MYSAKAQSNQNYGTSQAMAATPSLPIPEALADTSNAMANLENIVSNLLSRISVVVCSMPPTADDKLCSAVRNECDLSQQIRQLGYRIDNLANEVNLRIQNLGL